VKKRYLLIAAIGAFAIGMIQITVNQNQVKARAQDIVEKDEAGHDVKADVAALQVFVDSHMQTSTTFVLKGSYNRAVSVARAAADSSTNGNIYSQAQVACGSRSDSVTQAKCVSRYVANNSTPGANPQPIIMPQANDFTKSFNGPTWTLDAAGISFLLGIGALAVAAYLFVL
jgi:hypothetical protein